MPRNAKGQFTSKNDDDGYFVQLPSPFSVLKMVIFAIILYPWYYILSKRSFASDIFEYFLQNTSTPTPIPTKKY